MGRGGSETSAKNCGYKFGWRKVWLILTPRWAKSADKHGVTRTDQIYAIVNATFVRELLGESLDDGRVFLYIGPQHAQTGREIEVLVNVYSDGREAFVFHAMPVGPKFEKYREENQ